ncbi:replication factor C subunit 1 [Ambystoma mexicanum]|uniref:replication factor C subunit 1 n=1 Tax=Ambystoma mexicanum TaxID=8296 RepID=UPI0037E99521
MDIRKFFGVVSTGKKPTSEPEKKEKSKSGEGTSMKKKKGKTKSPCNDGDSEQKHSNKKKRIIYDSDSEEEAPRPVKKTRKPAEKSPAETSPAEKAPSLELSKIPKRDPVTYVSETDEEEEFAVKKNSKKPKENGTSVASHILTTSEIGKQVDLKTRAKAKPPVQVQRTPTSALDYFGTASIHRSDKKLVASKRKEPVQSADESMLDDESIAKQLQLDEDAELERQMHEDEEFARTLSMLDEAPKNKKSRKDSEDKDMLVKSSPNKLIKHDQASTAKKLSTSEETSIICKNEYTKSESGKLIHPHAEVTPVKTGNSTSTLKASSKLATMKHKEEAKQKEPEVLTPVSKAKSNLPSENKTKKEKLSPQKSESSPEDSEKRKSNVKAYRNFLNRDGPRALGSKEIPLGKENCLEGMTFVITGVLESIERDEAKSLVERYGGKVTGNISKKTNYLILGRDGGESKREKAESLGTRILDEDGLFNLIRTTPGHKSKYEIAAEAEVKKSKIKPEKTPEKNKLGQKRHSPTKVEADHQNSTVKGCLLNTIKREASALTVKEPCKTDLKEKLPARSVCVAPELSKVDSLLWVDKYKPTSMKTVIGQQGDQSCANKLLRWLKNWHTNNTSGKKPASKYGKFGGKDDGSTFKAALLSGPPGVGKTTTASLVCEELGFSYVELNASDTRSKNSLKDVVAESLNNTSIKGFYCGVSQSVSMKHALIMDEVDGMAGNEDRGGMQELIGLIKNSRIPIICMCNDRNHPKIRSLANYCFDLRFQRPRVEQIKGAMMTIAFKEGLKIPPPAMNEIILGANQDIRQVLHNLSMWCARNKALTYDEAKGNANNARKDIKMGPFDVARKVFVTGEETAHMTLIDKSDLFFHDYSLAPLFVQENYVHVKPAAAGGNIKKHLLLLSKTADSICDGDLVDRQIRSKQMWSLLPTQAIYASVLPGELMRGYMSQFPTFPSWLGKFSSTGKHDRIMQELSRHMCLRTHTCKGGMNLDYLPYLRDALVRPLASQGADGVQEVVDLMDTYYLMKEDVENIMEISSWGGKPSPFSKLDPKVKAAFTRGYNKEAHLTPYSIQAVKISKRGAAALPDSEMNEEQYMEDSQAEDKGDDIETDAMIKAKKSKPSKTEKSGETKKGKGKGKKTK